MVPNEQQMGNESTKRSAPLACRTRVTTDSPGGRRAAGAVPGLGELRGRSERGDLADERVKKCQDRLIRTAARLTEP